MVVMMVVMVVVVGGIAVARACWRVGLDCAEEVDSTGARDGGETRGERHCVNGH